MRRGARGGWGVSGLGFRGGEGRMVGCRKEKGGEREVEVGA